MAAQTSIVRLTFTASLQGKLQYNVFNFAALPTDPIITPAAADALAAQVQGGWEGAFKTELSNQYFFKGVQPTILGASITNPSPPPARKALVEYTGPFIASATVGAQASEPLPQFDAIYIGFKTSSGLQSYRGACHIGGLPENAGEGQFINVAKLATLQASATALFVPATVVVVGADTWNFAQQVYSHKLHMDASLGASPWTYTRHIIHAPVSPRVGSMLNRKSRAIP